VYRAFFIDRAPFQVNNLARFSLCRWQRKQGGRHHPPIADRQIKFLLLQLMPGTAWIETISRAARAIAPTPCSAAGYNFSLLLRWLERLLRALIAVLTEPIAGTRSN